MDNKPEFSDVRFTTTILYRFSTHVYQSIIQRLLLMWSTTVQHIHALMNSVTLDDLSHQGRYLLIQLAKKMNKCPRVPIMLGLICVKDVVYFEG